MSNKVTKNELAEFRKGKGNVKEYTNGEISVFWKADLCIHSANCLIAEPGVFNNSRRPWIDMKGASTKDIIKAVNTCPSRALTFLKNTREKAAPRKKTSKNTPKFARVQILKDGPLMITGNFILRDSKKKKIRVETDTVALCRCGASKTKPFCDGNHLAEKFLGD